MKAKRTIIHLTRSDGTPFFLHPFGRRGSLLDVPAGDELEGFYGQEPRVESLTILRNELYRRIDEDIRDWINEKRFIPRFLVSSAAFLVTFLFMALVVHTPIPLVDELLGSLGAAILTFILVGRRFEHSRVATRQRVTLRTIVDGVVFLEHPLVETLEPLFQQLEQVDPLANSVDAVRNIDLDQLWSFDRDQTVALIELLRSVVTLPGYKRFRKDRRRRKLSEKTRDAIETGTISAAAVLLYDGLREYQATRS